MINVREEQSIRDRAGDLIMTWQTEVRGAVESLDLDGYLDLVVAASIAGDEAQLALRRWVSAARRAGASWEQIGTALGITRQAAQKRFASEPASAGEADTRPELKTRAGVTAFNEVDVLREEGEAGYEVVGAGFGRLRFRKANGPVHNIRVVSLRRGRLIAEMEAEGWRHALSWYPYTYYTRPQNQAEGRAEDGAGGGAEADTTA